MYDLDEIHTTFGKNTLFNGNLSFKQSLRIQGRYEGKIDSTGFLYVDQDAEVIADVKVRVLIVAGVIKGNVEASEEVELLSTGKVYGNIKAGKLKIADGVVFEGKVEMLKDPDSLDIFSASPAQLKQSLDNV
jgi:cytoskeletal protein CcmA (bactofilin family)